MLGYARQWGGGGGKHVLVGVVLQSGWLCLKSGTDGTRCEDLHWGRRQYQRRCVVMLHLMIGAGV